jgi:hypothetical protein
MADEFKWEGKEAQFPQTIYAGVPDMEEESAFVPAFSRMVEVEDIMPGEECLVGVYELVEVRHVTVDVNVREILAIAKAN